MSVSDDVVARVNPILAPLWFEMFEDFLRVKI